MLEIKGTVQEEKPIFNLMYGPRDKTMLSQHIAL